MREFWLLVLIVWMTTPGASLRVDVVLCRHVGAAYVVLSQCQAAALPVCLLASVCKSVGGGVRWQVICQSDFAAFLMICFALCFLQEMKLVWCFAQFADLKKDMLMWQPGVDVAVVDMRKA
jgi:hypothetical protein